MRPAADDEFAAGEVVFQVAEGGEQVGNASFAGGGFFVVESKSRNGAFSSELVC